MKNYRNQEMAVLENQQKEILQQLVELKNQMLEIKKTLQSNKADLGLKSSPKKLPSSSLKIENVPDLIVNANPKNPPYSLLCIQRLWSNIINLKVKTYTHSTISKITKEAERLSSELEGFKCTESIPVISLRLIWKNVGADVELLVRHYPIMGEVNVLRYLSRLLQGPFNYELSPKCLEIDSVLDLCYLLLCSKSKGERINLLQQLDKKLGKSGWFCDSSSVSIADIAAQSTLKNIPSNEINQNLTKWLQKCTQQITCKV
ncbi:probable aminoacyl tRNA synthase complex-interacting multifunctional protein 2 isoform X1 [Agrilus planipennis]|uniref:Probable aminoacyl tRNA synthase complex-interacting multifunctional protein 2 isoform X1 n=2 Tax=Agrilus planipennis TaxID=224129 RepID=A0A7F5REI2_AGRPL|nr:probable aminoacyl tRNA synthase complex-interacting multifunctional protein 2 isoform X1 [Agrilus planipennis]